MPQVHHVKRAAKAYPNIGVKKGEPYYWWEFRYGGKRMSKTPPRPSQLTQSKMSGALAAGEALEDAVSAAGSPQDCIDALNEAASAITDVGQEYRDSVDAMPESLQNSPTGEDCTRKADELDEWASQLESDAGDIESLDISDYYETEADKKAEPGDFDALSPEGQAAMLEAAKELANQNTSCPVS